MAALILAALALVLLVSGGGAQARPAAGARVCTVTLPNGSYGNRGLTTGLWEFGVIVADATYIQPDGSVKMKFPFWRDTRGELHVSGRRLDRRAPPLKVEIAPGYGVTGLQPTYLIFPTAGCWRVTARVGTVRLAFTTLVVKAPHLKPG